jgi:IS4 transposase
MSANNRAGGITELYKKKLRYNTFITTVGASILPLTVINKTYYLRWQIEMVFKTWKSFFRIDKIKRVKKERLECQLLASCCGY